MSEISLRITEIFHSLQGETSLSGLPTGFVRLTGCPLRCVWCDSAYAFEGGERFTIESILQRLETFRVQYVTVTGGEPLAQPNCLLLLTALADAGYRVSLETSGALSIKNVDPRIMVIMDLKAPGSGESHRNLWDNLRYLKASDQIKFVIADRQDYEWSKSKILDYALESRVAELLFSPVNNELSPTDLADWILHDRLKVRFQLQLHKYLWNNEPGH